MLTEIFFFHFVHLSNLVLIVIGGKLRSFLQMMKTLLYNILIKLPQLHINEYGLYLKLVEI